MAARPRHEVVQSMANHRADMLMNVVAGLQRLSRPVERAALPVEDVVIFEDLFALP
jgi:hypothetical protein